MNKTLICIIFLLLNPIVFSATHCWEILGNDTSPTLNWTGGSHVTLDPANQFVFNDANIKAIVMPMTTAKFTGFGNYNIVCNNGAVNQIVPFAKLELLDSANNSKKLQYNTPNNACAELFHNLPYCTTVNGKLQDDPNNTPVGKGNFQTAEIYFDPNDLNLGAYTLNGFIDTKTIAGKCGNALVNKFSETFLFINQYPSLFIFTPTKKTLKFYDTNGYYEEEIFFTIAKNHPLKIRIDNLNLTCDNDYGATCEIIDKSRIEGLVLTEWKDLLIVTAKIRIDKNKIKNQPLNENMAITLKLDANYSLPQAPGMGKYVTTSPPKIYTIGLIDQQDFQIKIQGGTDKLTECVSHEGLIGVTGPDYSPRINLTFADDGKINATTCDLKNLNGEDNNWIYCSQTEFLFSLASKIGKIIETKTDLSSELRKVDINNTAINLLNNELSKYSSTEVHIRDTDLSKNKISEHLNNFNIGFAEFDGLEGFNGTPVNYVGSTADGRKIRLKKLFAESNVINFRLEGGVMDGSTLLPAGKYDMEINIVKPSENDLFDTDGNINTEYLIEVNLSNRVAPNIDWFFYRNDMSEISADRIEYTTPHFSNTNISERGIVLTFNKQILGTDPEKIQLTKTFAVPLFIKIDKINDIVSNKFTVKNITPSLTKNGIFSYWTGFASNIGAGCEEISPNQTETTKSLYYKLPDTIMNAKSDGEILVSLEEYNDINSNKIELLQTVIYAPLKAEAILDKIQIIGPISIYGKTSSTNCTYTDTNCSIDLNRNSSGYYSDNIKDMFEKINNREICIAEEFAGNDKSWTLFWNEEELLKSLNVSKQTIVNSISGLKLCEPN